MSLTVRIDPGTYDASASFYPRVSNAHLHPLVRAFLRLGNERIGQRYCHLHPEVDKDAVEQLLAAQPRWLRWAGADLFHVADDRGRRRYVVIETNSSPSGQKSMPLLDEELEQAGYRVLLERTFLPLLKRRGLPEGRLAVLWDKNAMEVGGYAATLADLTGEPVLLARLPQDRPDAVQVHDGVLHVEDEAGAFVPVRAALRYVTQRPWSRIPPITKTALLNPVIACLAGGRNKLLAAKAYDLFNAAHREAGLQIAVPETIWDVSLEQVPLWVSLMGGVAVVKVPYSNAGQGVFTITTPAELDEFLELEHPYERFIVQGLIGNSRWSSRTRHGRLFHVGTMPDRLGHIHVADLRMMVGASPGGFYPVALYARRAREPLVADLEPGMSSWDMLGTNLSVKEADGNFSTEPERLLLMDSRDFNRLGVGVDDLIEAYVQTIMAVCAIDDMAVQLVTSKGRFRRKLFRSLNPDPALLAEMLAESV